MKRYLILHYPRSGSHALMHALAENGLGHTREIMGLKSFSGGRWPQSPSALVHELGSMIAHAENEKGCVIKFQLQFYDDACDAAWVSPDINERSRLLLEVFSPGWTFIYLYRRDVDSFAVSTAFGTVSQRWTIHEKGIPVTMEDYNEELLERCRLWYERCKEAMDRYSELIPGYKVAYEDLVKDPGFLEKALGVDLSRIRNKTDYMPDPVKQQWLEKYRLVRA